jgi:hypothetical protein
VVPSGKVAEVVVRQRTRLALPFVFLTSGCLVAAPKSFQTPQETVLTFQWAFAHDDELLEYDCFARELKVEQGLDQQKWSLARGLVFDSFGAVGRFVLRRNSLEDNLVTASADGRVARLDYRMFGHELTVALVPELVMVLLGEGERELGRMAPHLESATTASLLFRGELWSESHDLDHDVVALELRREWKIREILPPADTRPPLPLPAPSRPGELRVVRGDAPPRIETLGGGLGVQRVRVKLATTAELSGAATESALAWRLAAPLRWERRPSATAAERGTTASGRACAALRASPFSRAVFSPARQ